jgi:5,10-methylenetetrahydrofolate reductase
VEALRHERPLITAELRPPRADLEGEGAMDAWIDLERAIRGFTSAGHHVFLTDDAVGQAEEENLAHLEGNLGDSVRRERLIPFLTAKHSLEYCLLYAQRAASRGFGALTVLGGDTSVGRPRCVPHAYQLRERIRRHVPELLLGGWANPFRDPGEQAGYLAAPRATNDFFLTQVVSHHDAHRVEALWRALRERDVSTPGLAGVFHYRSANPKTLSRLAAFLPVPADRITREFAAGATAEEITARSVRAVLNAGAPGVYISNLRLRSARRTLARILELARH